MASSSSGSSSVATGVYLDQYTLKASIQRMTIASIKPVIKEINPLTGMPMPNIGNLRKAELVDLLCNIFNRLQSERKEEQYAMARRILESKYGSTIQPFRTGNDTIHRPTNSFHPNNNAPNPSRLPPHHYSLPQNPNANHFSEVQASMNLTGKDVKFGEFKESPFYKLKEWIPPAKVCPQAPTHQRHSGSERIYLQFTPSQCQLLQSTKPKYHARLFCTTYSASRASLNPRHPAPVEFPINCEVRVNRTQLSGNLRGKKTAAKVLPPDLNKDKKLQIRMGDRNEIEMSYIGTYQPYLLTVGICEYISPDILAERVKHDHVKSKQDVLREMKKAADDDDIEVGDVTINLKCPLSYMRLNTPCRSNVCAHIQCFDAMSFFSVNEQTPSWQCPICSKIIDPNGIFVDGYVLDILQKVPDSEESVHIDGEGRWRTPNNKYRSDDVELSKAKENENGDDTLIKGNTSMGSEGKNDEEQPLPRVKGETEELQSLAPIRRSTPGAAVPSAEQSTSNGNGKKRGIEVVELDDSPSPPRKAQKDSTFDFERRLSSQINGGTASSNPPSNLSPSAAETSKMLKEMMNAMKSQASEPPVAKEPSRPAVIDLTFSDSDDDDDIPLRPSTVNRPGIARPTGVRPPSFPHRLSTTSQRPPSLSPRPPNMPQRASDVPSGIANGQITTRGIAPMPLPPAPRHLGRGMQSIVQFLVPKDGTNQSNNSRSSGSSLDYRSATNSDNGNHNTFNRSTSTPNATSNTEDVRGQILSPFVRDFGDSRTGFHSARSSSFAGSSTGATYASGLFNAPDSPLYGSPARRMNGVTLLDANDEADAPPSSQTQESETADEEPTNGIENGTSTERTSNDGTANEDDEDPIRAPHKRSRPVITSDEKLYDDEFADSELDQLDLDPDAGLGGSIVVQSKESNANNNGNRNGTIDRTKEIGGNSDNVNDGSSTLNSSSEGIPLIRRSDIPNDEEFQADERAGLGTGNL